MAGRSNTTTVVIAPRFDARRASPEQVRQRLAQLGIEPDPNMPVLARPGSPDPAGDRIAERQQQRILDATERADTRAAEVDRLARGADLRSTRLAPDAPAEAVRARMRELGLDAASSAVIRDAPPSQPAARRDAYDATSASAAIENEARRLLARARSGERIHASTIENEAVFKRYSQLRYASAGEWG